VSPAIRALILAVGVALLPLGSEAAVIQELSDELHGTYIDVDGSIAKGDSDAILHASKALLRRGHPLWIRINSRGGNLAEAMRIGRFVRKTLAAVVVDGSACYSACALILIGAADRHLTQAGTGPVVGIHRPYIADAVYGALTPEQARVTYARLEKDVKDYLTEMGAPGRFVDEMFRTPSTRMRLITDDEFQTMFALEEPFLEEWLISRCGALDEKESCKRAQLLAHQQSVLADR
jgi:hypothetical protein